MHIEYEGTMPKPCLYCGGSIIENEKHECITSGGWNSPLKTKDYKVNEPIEGMFPRANEQEAKDGWILSYRFLERISKEIIYHHDVPGLEGIELVLLTVEKDLL